MNNTNAKENAVQQAQQWAQEAKTQRGTVLSILRGLGLPENDWEAERLVLEKFALLSAQRSEVPAGYKLVPVEPTWEMICAAHGAERKADAVYRAMIEAAPQPSPEAAQQCEKCKGSVCQIHGIEGAVMCNSCDHVQDVQPASSDKAVVTDEREAFEQWWAGTGKFHSQPKENCFRAWEARALLQSAAPAMPVSEQNARFAIKGAIEYGRQGTNRPPAEDHWLMPFWQIGQKLAAPAQTVAKPETEREKFEKWALEERELPARYLAKDDDGEYKYPTVQCDWTTWQAAIASLSVSAQEQPLSRKHIEYPRDVFGEIISGNSPYAFYLFQWVPYQTEARRWRLKMTHDVRTFDGREAHGIWPNGDHCGPFRDEEVEFIRLSREQYGQAWQDPRPAAPSAAKQEGK